MLYTYDSEADVLYVLMADEPSAAIDRTIELASTIHADLDPVGNLVGIEFLYPRARGIDTEPVHRRFGIELRFPFTFAA